MERRQGRPETESQCRNRAGRQVWRPWLALVLALVLLVPGPPVQALPWGRSPNPKDGTGNLGVGKGSPLLQEVAPPEAVQQVQPLLASRQPRVKILSPSNDALVPPGPLTVRTEVQDWPLVDAGPLGLGPHLVAQLDDGPPQRFTTSTFTLEALQPGSHRLTVYAAKPWGEAVKAPGALQQIRLHRTAANPLQQPAPGSAQVLLSSPQAEVEGQPVLLDWLLLDAPLQHLREGDERWRLRVTVNGDSVLLDRLTPLWLRGWRPGSNALALELVDPRGEAINAPFNSLVREVVLGPASPGRPPSPWLGGALPAMDLAVLLGEAPRPEAPTEPPTKPPTEADAEVGPEAAPAAELPPPAGPLTTPLTTPLTPPAATTSAAALARETAGRSPQRGEGEPASAGPIGSNAGGAAAEAEAEAEATVVAAAAAATATATAEDEATPLTPDPRAGQPSGPGSDHAGAIRPGGAGALHPDDVGAPGPVREGEAGEPRSQGTGPDDAKPPVSSPDAATTPAPAQPPSDDPPAKPRSPAKPQTAAATGQAANPTATPGAQAAAPAPGHTPKARPTGPTATGPEPTGEEASGTASDGPMEPNTLTANATLRAVNGAMASQDGGSPAVALEPAAAAAEQALTPAPIPSNASSPESEPAGPTAASPREPKAGEAAGGTFAPPSAATQGPAADATQPPAAARTWPTPEAPGLSPANAAPQATTPGDTDPQARAANPSIRQSGPSTNAPSAAPAHGAPPAPAAGDGSLPSPPQAQLLNRLRLLLNRPSP